MFKINSTITCCVLTKSKGSLSSTKGYENQSQYTLPYISNRVVSRTVMIIVLSILYSSSSAQDITQHLSGFNKVRVSPHIKVVLIKGEQENLRLEYSGITVDELNYGVDGSSLEIYLTGAKLVDKYVTIRNNDENHKESYYKNAKVTAFITYRELKSLDLRSEEGAVCEYPLKAKNLPLSFTVKIWFGWLIWIPRN